MFHGFLFLLLHCCLFCSGMLNRRVTDLGLESFGVFFSPFPSAFALTGAIREREEIVITVCCLSGPSICCLSWNWEYCVWLCLETKFKRACPWQSSELGSSGKDTQLGSCQQSWDKADQSDQAEQLPGQGAWPHTQPGWGHTPAPELPPHSACPEPGCASTRMDAPDSTGQQLML